MAESRTGALLRKRMAPARPVRRADESQLEQILNIEMPRSADKLLALEVAIQAVSQSVGASADVTDALNDSDLVCLMSSEDRPPGIIVADIGLISAGIEIQTLGKVTPAPPQERPATRLDIVILSDLIDKWMTDVRVAAEANGCAEVIPFYGYTRAPRQLSVRAVELMLEPIAYRSIRISLALGGAAKTGMLTLVVPESGQSVRQAVSGTVGQRLEPHILEAPLALDAVIDRFEMSLHDVLAFEPGQVIEVSRELIGKVRIEADGRFIDHAHLGRQDGKRVVRLGAAEVALPMVTKASDPAEPMDVIDEAPPEMPDLPQLPELPEELPDPPEDLPELPELPDDLPDLPDIGADVGATEAADLPDLPDLQDLPDLPELPDLPDD